ncbi:MAG: hypothetical protein IPP17_23510 [Bacteroidetes bacterium]|nr:hypothetical protein [Bacteroidota bacterium]
MSANFAGKKLDDSGSESGGFHKVLWTCKPLEKRSKARKILQQCLEYLAMRQGLFIINLREVVQQFLTDSGIREWIIARDAPDFVVLRQRMSFFVRTQEHGKHQRVDCRKFGQFLRFWLISQEFPVVSDEIVPCNVLCACCESVEVVEGRAFVGLAIEDGTNCSQLFLAFLDLKVNVENLRARQTYAVSLNSGGR